MHGKSMPPQFSGRPQVPLALQQAFPLEARAGSLIDEFKARRHLESQDRLNKEAAYNTLLARQATLTQQINLLTGRDSRWWPERTALQHQLAVVEQELRLAQAARAQQQEAELIQKDKHGRFTQVLRALLQKCPERTLLLSQVFADKTVQREWRELQLSRIIRKSTEMIEVLREKSDVFEIYSDKEGRSALRFTGETGTTDLVPMTNMGAPIMALTPAPVAIPLPTPWQNTPPVASSALALPGTATHPAAAVSAATLIVPDLLPEQKEEVEAQLLRAGGSERFRRIALHCGVQEQQLAKWFRLYQDQGKAMVTHLCPERARLELMLHQLSMSRNAVMEAMAFCMEHAALRVAIFARCLIKSLEVPDVSRDVMIARLFLVSDVLHNSNSGAPGAARYRAIFEETLPDACEHLGRVWFPRMEQGTPEREKAESAIRRMLDAWRSWEVFPSVFIGGLESLLLEPAPDPNADTAAVAPEQEADPVLRQKLARWCNEEVDPAELRIAARRRGLAGPSLPVAGCRLRFCHYERYWHRAALEAPEPCDSEAAAAMEEERLSIDGDDLSDGDLDGLDDLGRQKPVLVSKRTLGEGVHIKPEAVD